MMKAWGVTDTGLVRKENQDAYAVCQADMATVCVVCDGMGGVSGGKLASSIAVRTYSEELIRVLRPHMTPEQLREASSYAVSLANEAVRTRAATEEGCRNMGTTLVSAISYDGGVVVSNVGDSRAYHISPDGITRITRDHSLVENMVERGDITEEEARRHPNKNLITRALGPDENADCDGFICPLEKGDFVLLCSDGLVDTVTDQEMLYEVIHGGELDTCLDRLMEIAKSRGAADNVTVVLMQNN